MFGSNTAHMISQSLPKCGISTGQSEPATTHQITINKGAANASDAMPFRIFCNTLGNCCVVCAMTSHERLKLTKGPHALEEGMLLKTRRETAHQNMIYSHTTTHNNCLPQKASMSLGCICLWPKDIFLWIPFHSQPVMCPNIWMRPAATQCKNQEDPITLYTAPCLLGHHTLPYWKTASNQILMASRGGLHRGFFSITVSK